jgi:hypothetical protein
VTVRWWGQYLRGRRDDENVLRRKHSSTLKTDAAGSSETLVTFYKAAWHQIPEDCNLCNTLLAACFMLVSFFAYSLTLKMEATCSSKIPVDFSLSKHCYIPENRVLHSRCCKNFKSILAELDQMDSYVAHILSR